MTRDEALKLLDEKIKNRNLIKHSLAVEAVMRKLAEHFKEDQEVWGLAGLLHDLDYEVTASDWTKHGVLANEWLKPHNLPKEVGDIILAHNSDVLGTALNTTGEKAIFAVDPVTGLIVAAALMTPNKKIKELPINSLMKRFRSSGFAKGANREFIQSCTDFNMDLEEFLKLSLEAMQEIDKELGL